MIEFLKSTEGIWAVVIAGIALLFTGYQLIQANRLRKYEFADIYVQRYWAIMDQLTAEQKQKLYTGDRARELIHDEKVRNILWKYLELCEDQADLRAVNMINTATWKQWRGGVEMASNQPPYSVILDEFMKSFPADAADKDLPFARLRSARVEPQPYDPREAWWIRLVEGLVNACRYLCGLRAAGSPKQN
ncbi:hypothetical protein ACR5KS_11680 [Leucobacter sp. W1153]|uniref:hypothetical protein n=1 Tax=Leucobacter sp. W1153 TaxID=3439064 RepID=UPI003F3F7EF8